MSDPHFKSAFFSTERVSLDSIIVRLTGRCVYVCKVALVSLSGWDVL